MKTAVVDTPWTSYTDPLTGGLAYGPELLHDPTMVGRFDGQDVTGEEGVDIGGGVILTGGNYAKASGVEPDYDTGRAGGSGDPDYLQVRIEFDEVAEPFLLEEIDADDRYHVYQDTIEVTEDGPVVFADDNPSFAAEWDYSDGTGPTTPNSGQMYFRTPAEVLSIHKTDAFGNDFSAQLLALKRHDKIQVGIEEYWEVRSVSDQGAYVDVEAADLQRGPSASDLPFQVHMFTFDTTGIYKRPGNYPNAVEWDALNGKMAARNYPTVWIEQNLGFDRQRPRTQVDQEIRIGYFVGQFSSGPSAANGWTSLADYLEVQGWNVVDRTVKSITVRLFTMQEHVITLLQVITCNFDTLPRPLAQDIARWRLDEIGVPCY